MEEYRSMYEITTSKLGVVTLAAMPEAEEISRNPHAKGYRDVASIFSDTIQK